MTQSPSTKQLTHGGGVVFRPTPSGPEFLVVQSSKNKTDWVLPKGHIEAGETPEQTAVREVREEAGVVARSLGPLGDAAFAAPGGEVRVRFFLMRFEHGAPADEERKTAWLPHDAARARLTYEDHRRLLDQAQLRSQSGL